MTKMVKKIVVHPGLTKMVDGKMQKIPVNTVVDVSEESVAKKPSFYADLPVGISVESKDYDALKKEIANLKEENDRLRADIDSMLSDGETEESEKPKRGRPAKSETNQ